VSETLALVKNNFLYNALGKNARKETNILKRRRKKGFRVFRN